jgi:hypothetical protein
MSGVNPATSLTSYSSARIEGGKIRLKTAEIALGGFINFWIADVAGRHYFADMGGNPNDNPPIGAPGQTIFSSTGTNSKYLGTRLRMPVSGVGLNNKLYLVSSEGLGQNKSTIVEVDPTTHQKRELLMSPTARFMTLKVLSGTTDLVTIATMENKIVILDSKSGQIRRELLTKGFTRDTAFLGHCVIAGDDKNNMVEIFDLRKNENAAFMAGELNLPAQDFSGIKSIAVDPNTGTIFARSNVPCNPAIESCENEYNRVVSFGLKFGQQVKEACQ